MAIRLVGVDDASLGRLVQGGHIDPGRIFGRRRVVTAAGRIPIFLQGFQLGTDVAVVYRALGDTPGIFLR